MMKILHITTGYWQGGAGIACKRLVEAQLEAGFDVSVLTQEEGVFPDYVHSLSNSWIKKKLRIYRLAWEKFVYLFYQSSGQYRFQYSLANTGVNIANNKYVKEADIIHLHWINSGFLSLKSIQKLLRLNKPVVWTLHDIWPATGGCHITSDCEEFKGDCFNCFYFRPAFKNIIPHKHLLRKQRIYSAKNLSFVTPSNWQLSRAKASFLLKDKQVIKIHNCIGGGIYLADRQEVRKNLNLPLNKKLLLFGAFNVSAKHKGMEYLIKALSQLETKCNFELVVFGKVSEQLQKINLKVHDVGYISSEVKMMQLYRSADLFITPSIEDNLPNTVLESFLCKTPVVAFKTGGIPEIIDHKKNGYLAEYKNPVDLALGITWCMENIEKTQLGENAFRKIEERFSNAKVSKQFKDFYNELLLNS